MKRMLICFLCIATALTAFSCQNGGSDQTDESTTESMVISTSDTESVPPETALRCAVLLPKSAGGKVVAAGKAIAERVTSLGGEVTVSVGAIEGEYDCRILLGEIGDNVYDNAMQDLADGKCRLVCDGGTVLVGGKSEDDVSFGAKLLIKELLKDKVDALTEEYSKTVDAFYTETPAENTVATSVKDGNLILASYFSDHMILQAERTFTVSGTSVPGTSVSVVLAGEDGGKVSEAEAVVFGSGYFEVELPAVKGGYEAYTLTVTGDGEDEVVLRDVLFGEVWIASGQSNMEYKLKHAMEKDGSYSIDALKKDEYLRGLTFYPNNASWSLGNTRAIGGVSAVAYYFARQLRSVLDVPVAVVDATYGGTDLYAWLDLADLYFNDTAFEFVSTTSITIGNYYAERVYPMRGMQVRGLIWYQGENNIYNTAGTYREGFEVLRESYAYLFGYASGAELPTVVSHIAPYCYSDSTNIILGNFAQEFDAIAKAHPETTAQVTVYNEPLDYESQSPNYSCNTLHPSIKEGIGTNMGKAAYSLVYEGKNEATSPAFVSAEVKDGAFYVKLDHVGDTLAAGNNGRIYGFTVCGEERIFLPAEAEIIASDTVKVYCEAITEPVALTYAYTNLNGEANLYSTEEGELLFAAVPFAYGITASDRIFTPQQWIYCENETLWHTLGNDGGYYPTWEAEGAVLEFTDTAYRGSGALAISFEGKNPFSVSPCLSFGKSAASDLNRGYTAYKGISVKIKGDAVLTELVVCGDENELTLTSQTAEAENGWTTYTFLFGSAEMEASDMTLLLRKVMAMHFNFAGQTDSGTVFLDEVNFLL